MGVRTGNPRGRPKGSKSLKTIKREELLTETAARVAKMLPDAFDGDAHTLLMCVYKDTSLEWNLRIDAAKAAIRYEKPALAAVDHKGNLDVNASVLFKTIYENRGN